MQFLVKIQYAKRYYKKVVYFVVGYKLSPFTTGSLFYKHLCLSYPNWIRTVCRVLFVCSMLCNVRIEHLLVLIKCVIQLLPVFWFTVKDTVFRARSEPGGTRWRTGGEVKGKLANGVGSQCSHATSERGISSSTKADAHTSAASCRLNWRPHRFEWTRPFRGKTKSGFCACAITFRTSYTPI